jgi:hypothetical protein
VTFTSPKSRSSKSSKPESSTHRTTSRKHRPSTRHAAKRKPSKSTRGTHH